MPLELLNICSYFHDFLSRLKILDIRSCAVTLIVLQDGCIDYGEFAAMMRKGDGGDGGIGRSRTMRGNLKFNLADAFGVKDSS